LEGPAAALASLPRIGCIAPITIRRRGMDPGGKENLAAHDPLWHLRADRR
jgi:hypothetical protein